MDQDREFIHQLIDELSDDHLFEAKEALLRFKTESQPPYLYHYTDEQGLKGILTNNAIWLTVFNRLNDYAELKYTIELITDYKIIDESTKNWFYDVLKEAHIGVFSLSTNGDQLSQWRGYCPKEGGYAIGFDFQKLKSLLEKQGLAYGTSNFELIRCIYNKEQQRKIISNFFKEKRSPDQIHLENFIKQIGLAIKHPSFNEEKEWRIISRIISPQFNDINQFKWFPFHEKNRLPIDLNDNGQLPICEIKVGPCEEKESGIKKVKEILDEAKLSCSCKISKSDIPFRPT
jgi:hypothetical protein